MPSAEEGAFPGELDFEFLVIVTRNFQRRIEKVKNPVQRKKVYQAIRDLARSRKTWAGASVKMIDVGVASRALRSARIDDKLRLIWEGPISSARSPRPILLIHDFLHHDRYERTIRGSAKISLASGPIREEDFDPDETPMPSVRLSDDLVAFSKPIPPQAFLGPDRLDAVFESTKANILLTQRQSEVLLADRPLLVHGHAGSGKTTVLCHRLALSILDHRTRGDPGKMAFLSYNEKLVRVAQRDTREILRDLHFARDDTQMVDFLPFQALLKRYCPCPDAFEPKDYVPFGRFKYLYETYRRGSVAARRTPPELAWHGVRSILKGACVPPMRPPLGLEQYEALARRRRDFEEDTFQDIYAIGEWYQREIRSRGLWDDQDLAWHALNWIMLEKERNRDMQSYSEVFCDEVQDLTELEFRLLVALCRLMRTPNGDTLPLALSGDPLQTINPTGFRWSVVGSEIYRVEGKPVRIHELQENFRSDKRIVAFANRIQEFRGYYLRQQLTKQEAFEKDGDCPQILTLETDDEVRAIQDELGLLPPESAVVVWADEEAAARDLFAKESALAKVDRELDFYTVPEAKGLEFRLVILYKFGSSPDAQRWRSYLMEKKKPEEVEEIPLLYFLNRMYVSITRAREFLIVVDSPEAVRDFWSKFPEVNPVPRADLRTVLETHPAFRGDMTEHAWRAWADTLFEAAEKHRDIRSYERAHRAYQKAKEHQSVKRVEARLAEIREDWRLAGGLYEEVGDTAQAGHCYERAGLLEKALEAFARLPTTPEIKRKIEVLKFRIDVRRTPLEAAKAFLPFALSDEPVEKDVLRLLAETLRAKGALDNAAQVFVELAETHQDRNAYIEAAECASQSGDFAQALTYYRAGGDTSSDGFRLAAAEEDIGKGRIPEGTEKLFELSKFDRVVEVASDEGNLNKARGKPGEYARVIRLCAEACLATGRHPQALKHYRTLLGLPGFNAAGATREEVHEKIGDILKGAGDMQAAVEKYKEAHAYDKAVELASSMGAPREELALLRIEAAQSRGDFDRALRLAQEMGFERKTHELRGHLLMQQEQYATAAAEFALAEEWTEALDSLEVGTMPSFDLWKARCGVIAAIARSETRPKSQERERVLHWILQVQEDPAWESLVTREEMGRAYEKCGSFVEAATYYEANFPAPWARQGWIRVKQAQRNHHAERGENERASRIDEEIARRRASWKE